MPVHPDPDRSDLLAPVTGASLRDPTRCPLCGTRVTASRCHGCGLDLTLPELNRAYELGCEAAELLERRHSLLVELRDRSRAASMAQDAAGPVSDLTAPSLPAAPDPTIAAAPAAAPLPTPPPPVAPAPTAAAASPVAPFDPGPLRAAGPDAPLGPPPPRPAPSPVPSRALPPTPDRPRRRVTPQTVLLGTGLVFLGIAALVFLTVAFVLFDLAVKALIVGGVTVAVFALATVLRRRGLNASAEGLSALGMVLLGLDAWAARATGLVPESGLPLGTYWGLALLVLATVGVGWGALAGLRLPRLIGVAAIVPALALLIAGLTEPAAPRLVPLALGGLVAGIGLVLPITDRRRRLPEPEAALIAVPALALAALVPVLSVFAALREDSAVDQSPAAALVAVGMVGAIAFLAPRPSEFLRALAPPASILLAYAWLATLYFAATGVQGGSAAPALLSCALIVPFGLTLAWMRGLSRATMLAGTVTTGVALAAAAVLESPRWAAGIVAARVEGAALSDPLASAAAGYALGGAVAALLGAGFALIALRVVAPGAGRRRLAFVASALALWGLLVAAYFVDAAAAPFLLTTLLAAVVLAAIRMQSRASNSTDAAAALRRGFVDAAQFATALALLVSVDVTSEALIAALAAVAVLFTVRLVGDRAPAGASTAVGLGVVGLALVIRAVTWTQPPLSVWTFSIALGAALLPLIAVPLLRRDPLASTRSALSGLAAGLLVLVAGVGAAVEADPLARAATPLTLVLALGALGLILVTARNADRRRAHLADHPDVESPEPRLILDDPLRISIAPLVTIASGTALEFAGLDGWGFAGALSVAVGALAAALDAAYRRRDGVDRVAIGEVLGLIALVPVAATLVATGATGELRARDLITLAVLVAATGAVAWWRPEHRRLPLWRHLVPWAGALAAYVVGFFVVPSLWPGLDLLVGAAPAMLVAVAAVVVFASTPRSSTVLGRAALAVATAAALVPLYPPLALGWGDDVGRPEVPAILVLGLAALVVTAFWPRAERFHPLRSTAVTLSGMAVIAALAQALEFGAGVAPTGWAAAVSGAVLLVVLVLAQRPATTQVSSLTTTGGVLLAALVAAALWVDEPAGGFVLGAAAVVAATGAAAVAARTHRHAWATVIASLGAVIFAVAALRGALDESAGVDLDGTMIELVIVAVVALAAAVLAIATAARDHRSFRAMLAVTAPAPVALWLAIATAALALDEPRLVVVAAALVSLAAGVVTVARRQRPDALALAAAVAALPLPLIALALLGNAAPAWLAGVAISASAATGVLIAPALPRELGARRHQVSFAAQLLLALGGVLVVVGGVPDVFIPLTLLPSPFAALGSCLWLCSEREAPAAETRVPTAPMIAAWGVGWLGAAAMLWREGTVADATTRILLVAVPLAAAATAAAIARRPLADSGLAAVRDRAFAAALAVSGPVTVALAAGALRIDPVTSSGEWLARLLPLIAAVLLATAFVVAGWRAEGERLGTPGMLLTTGLAFGIATTPLFGLLDRVGPDATGLRDGLPALIVIAVSVLVAQVPLAALGRRAAPTNGPVETGFALAAAASSAAIAWTMPAVRSSEQLEWTLLPLAAGLLLWGHGRMRLDAQSRSRVVLAPGIAVALVPSLTAEALDPNVPRIVLVTVLVVAAICWGAFGRLQAPLLLGGAAALVHAVIAVRTAWPELVVPWWAWLALAGVVLVTLAVTYEARMRDLRRLRVAIEALR